MAGLRVALPPFMASMRQPHRSWEAGLAPVEQALGNFQRQEAHTRKQRPRSARQAAACGLALLHRASDSPANHTLTLAPFEEARSSLNVEDV